MVSGEQLVGLKVSLPYYLSLLPCLFLSLYCLSLSPLSSYLSLLPLSLPTHTHTHTHTHTTCHWLTPLPPLSHLYLSSHISLFPLSVYLYILPLVLTLPSPLLSLSSCFSRSLFLLHFFLYYLSLSSYLLYCLNLCVYTYIVSLPIYLYSRPLSILSHTDCFLTSQHLCLRSGFNCFVPCLLFFSVLFWLLLFFYIEQLDFVGGIWRSYHSTYHSLYLFGNLRAKEIDPLYSAGFSNRVDLIWIEVQSFMFPVVASVIDRAGDREMKHPNKSALKFV